MRRIVLDDPHDELPLAVSLEKSRPVAGRAGVSVCRRLPHAAALDFLPAIGLPREWRCARHRHDAASLLGLTFEHLRPLAGEAAIVGVAFPLYLSPGQVKVVTNAAEKVGLPVITSVVTPLALVAGFEHPFQPTVLVIDVDDHALTAAVIRCERGQARLAGSAVMETLGLRHWKQRLLDALADRCVRLCRRDPRDSAVAEQLLFDQLDDALERCAQGQRIDLTVRSEHWYQNLSFLPDEFAALAAPLVRPALSALSEACAARPVGEPPEVIWFTHAAGRLPGLARALEADLGERALLKVLPADASAQAAATLAGRAALGEVPRLHLDTAIPLPPGIIPATQHVVRPQPRSEPHYEPEPPT